MRLDYDAPAGCPDSTAFAAECGRARRALERGRSGREREDHGELLATAGECIRRDVVITDDSGNRRRARYAAIRAPRWSAPSRSPLR